MGTFQYTVDRTELLPRWHATGRHRRRRTKTNCSPLSYVLDRLLPLASLKLPLATSRPRLTRPCPGTPGNGSRSGDVAGPLRVPLPRRSGRGRRRRVRVPRRASRRGSALGRRRALLRREARAFAPAGARIGALLPSAVPGRGARVLRADVASRPAMRRAPLARPPPPRLRLQETQGYRRRRQQPRGGWVSARGTGDAFPAAPLAGLVLVLVLGVLGRLGKERAPRAAVVFPASDAVGARGEPAPPHVVQDETYRRRQGRRRPGRAAAPEAAGAGGRAPAPGPSLVFFVLGVLLGLLQEPSRGRGAVAAARPLSSVPARGGRGEPARERVRTRGVPRPGALLEHAGVGGRRAAPAAAEGHGAVLLGQCARGSRDQCLRLRPPVHAVVAGQGEGRRGP
jgi:hypothetical protein